jgi:hypothetical protein
MTIDEQTGEEGQGIENRVEIILDQQPHICTTAVSKTRILNNEEGHFHDTSSPETFYESIEVFPLICKVSSMSVIIENSPYYNSTYIPESLK